MKLRGALPVFIENLSNGVHKQVIWLDLLINLIIQLVP